MLFFSLLVLIVCLALFSRYNDSILYTRLSAIIFIYAGLLSFHSLHIQSIGLGIGIYSGLFHVTIVNQVLEICLLFIGSLILTAWPLFRITISKEGTDKHELSYFKDSSGILDKLFFFRKYASSYVILILFSTLGSSLLISSFDLMSLYLSIELQSFGLYILAALYKESEISTSAGLKYFLLGGLSSCIILLGATLIYAYTGLTQFDAIYSMIIVSNNYQLLSGVGLGLVFIFVGCLFKIAAAPLHNWAPDVYNDTPTLVTIWLTIVPKIAILLLLLELNVELGLNIVLSNEIEFKSLLIEWKDNYVYIFKYIFLLSSLLSLIIGSIVGLAQIYIKRLLAYSTIAHIGFMLLALAINTEQSLDAYLFYVIQYSMTNLNMFLILISMSYSWSHFSWPSCNINDIKFISELKGQFYKNPLLSVSMTVSLFSMAGIPPLIGFFSKQYILYSALQGGYIFMSIIAILVSIISASYYLKIINVLHTQSEDKDTQVNSIITKKMILNKYFIFDINENLISNVHSFIISSLTLFIIVFIFKPSILLNSTEILSLSFFY